MKLYSEEELKAFWKRAREFGYLGNYKLKSDRMLSKDRPDPNYLKGSIVKIVHYTPHDGGQFDTSNGVWFRSSQLEPIDKE